MVHYHFAPSFIGDPPFVSIRGEEDEVILYFEPSRALLRAIIVEAMPEMEHWIKYRYQEVKSLMEDYGFDTEKELFVELLTNGRNDSSVLLFAHHPDVAADEEILFLALERDAKLGMVQSAFFVYATEAQRNDPELVRRVLERFPDAEV